MIRLPCFSYRYASVAVFIFSGGALGWKPPPSSLLFMYFFLNVDGVYPRNRRRCVRKTLPILRKRHLLPTRRLKFGRDRARRAMVMRRALHYLGRKRRGIKGERDWAFFAYRYASLNGSGRVLIWEAFQFRFLFTIFHF